MSKQYDYPDSPLYRLRHSAAHLLAQAVLELHPDAKLGVGPPIDNGFYYDFDFSQPLREEDLQQIEQKMHEIAQRGLDITRIEASREEAEKLIRNIGQVPYKIELLQAIPEGETVSFYKQGDFIDLCRGPHVENTREIQHFKLLSLAGAYWRGNEKNKMLTRIYGTAFFTQEELEDYLHKLEEAKRRDHRKLGRELGLARARDSDSASRETEVRPMLPGLAAAAERLDGALARIEAPLKELREGLAARLDDEAETLDSATRQRIESVCRSLARRALDPLGAWRGMARAVAADATETGGPGETFVDWLEIVSRSGHEVDVGMRRHWVDPTAPFARVVAEPAHGMLVTSATLRDSAGDEEARWQAAEEITGAIHLLAPALRAAVPSPFDYAGQTRAFVVTDVARDDAAQVAAAYRVLFEASGGGALGLFTAIARLREVHRRIAAALEAAGITLLAQHVDAMDNATLVDVFRAEEDACLLGTDAMRDGVDVPGRSLRLIVFDRVPWPRPTILHRARRARFGGARPGQIDDRITRARLRQAFGRLIRKADDRGCFVLLDSRAPSRLLAGLPEGVAVQRAGLAEVAEAIRRFLASG